MTIATASLWGVEALGLGGVAAVVPAPSILAPALALTAPNVISSANGQFSLTMQSGGDLVETTKAGATVWASGTSSAGSFAEMQTDGNFVVYDAGSHPLWATNTVGNPGAYLSLGNLGQLSVDTGNGLPLWEPGNVPGGTTLAAGKSVALPGGQFRLTMQTDGNLVETNAAAKAVWSSGTKATGAFAAMQADGNLVVYDATSKPLWASNTIGNPSAHLTIGGAGQLAIETVSGLTVWEPGGLGSGITLASGASTVLPGGRYRLTMQTTGNLVETSAGGTVMWASGTTSAGAHAMMQSDGNLVVYSTAAAVLWASNTAGNPGAFLTMNSHGQLVIDSATGNPLWGPGLLLGTHATFPSTDELTTGQSILSNALSTGEQYQLVMQSDGNLVEYTDSGSSLWASGTKSPGAHAVMQADGNFVVYSTTSTPLWASNTVGNAAAVLTMCDLGQLAIGSSAGVVLWSSPAGGPGLPVAPSAVSAVAGNGIVPDAAAAVSWTPAPPNTWSAPVWGYRVIASPGGASAFVAAPATSAIVPGLTDGTSYTFTVSAVNSAGAGAKSTPPSNSVTPRSSPVRPGPPIGIEAVPGNAQATVSWSPPVDNGGSAITGYVATASPGGQHTTAGPTAFSVVVSGLTNGVTYTVTVAATNSIGTGTASAPSAPVVPAATPFPSGSTITPDTTPSDWSMYNYSVSGNDWNTAEKGISSAHASTLSAAASATGAGPIQSSMPVVSFGHVFVGSNRGYESAFNAGTLASQWSTFLGTDGPIATCPNSFPYGVVSAPTSATVNGTTNVIYLSGGDAALYALNASTGGIIWRTQLGQPPNNFSFVSPLLYNGALYTGIASYGDCPLVQGQFFKINPLTGSIEATFDMAPNGCAGGGLWGSPSVDAAGHIFFATGTEVQGCTGTAEGVTGWQLETSVDEVDANLNLVGYWHLPEVDQVTDSDFGSVPTIFNAAAGSGQLVAIANKDGTVYAFDRQHLSAGPIWQTAVALGGPDPSFFGSISPMAYDGSQLYVAGEQTTISGKACGASLRALDPATGAVKWADCFASGPVLGPVTGANGVVVAAVHNSVVLVEAATGAQLASYTFTGAANTYSGGAISNGSIFAQNIGGNVVRLSPS